MIATTAQFHFIQIHNALEPRDSTREVRSFMPGQPLSELLPVEEGAQFAYTVNGQLIEEADLGRTYLSPGDFVTQCPIPEGGGGGGKTILRIAAMIAIAMVAPYMAAAMLGPGASAAALAFTKAAIMVGGSMVVNSVLAPPEPKREEVQSSPTYGADGAKNTSADGVVVPVTYGQFRIGGNIIENHVENDGDSQWLNILLNAGEGEVAPVSRDSILINDQSLATFDQEKMKPEFSFRAGTHDQLPQPWFQSTVTPKSINAKVTTSWLYAVTDAAADRLRFDFIAPTGIYEVVNSDGDQIVKVVIVYMTLQYRLYAEGQAPEANWTTFAPAPAVIGFDERNVYYLTKAINERGETVDVPYVPKPDVRTFIENGIIYEDHLRLVNTTPGGGGEGEYKIVPVAVGHVAYDPQYAPPGVLSMAGRERTIKRGSFATSKLPAGRYEIRVRRTNEEDESAAPTRTDQIIMTDLNSILDAPVAHRHTATVALRLRLSEQLSGIPRISFVTGGKILDYYNPTERTWMRGPSANPAWVVFDILGNARYGGGAPRSRFDLEAWIDWADHCDRNGLEFHGVFDAQSNVWDAANTVARCGHAQVVLLGTRFSVVIERAAEPTMMFNVANIIQGTFTENWLPMSERANEIELSYHDRADNYAQKTIRVVDGQAQAAGRPQRKSSIEMRGVVTAQRAYDEAWLALKLNRYTLRTVQFSAPIEAIACMPGDVILVQHDMPQWGQGGRAAAGSTPNMVKLDQKVTLEHGKTYQVLVHADAAMVKSDTINRVLGQFIVLNGPNQSGTRATRISIAGRDMEVLSYETLGNEWGVMVSAEDAAHAQAGSTWALYRLNAIMTRSVLNEALTGGFLETDELQLMQALDFAPERFTKWMFGPSNKTSKPFRVRRISGDQNMQREITAIEYNEGIYAPNGTVEEVNYSTLDTNRVKQALIDGVEEEIRLVGGTYQSIVTVRFSGQQQSYRDAEVFLSRDDSAFQSVGRDKSAVSVQGIPGETLTFRVVAFNQKNQHATVASAPQESILVRGRTAHAVSAPTNLRAEFTETGLLVTWDQPPEPDWEKTSIRVGTTRPAAALQYAGKSTRIELPWVSSFGAFSIFATHSIPGKDSSDATWPVTVQRPGTPQPVAVPTAAGVATVSWTSCRTSQPIARHVVKVGGIAESFDNLPIAGTLSGSGMVYTPAFTASGVYRVWVVAIDAGGIPGAPGYVDVAVNLSNVSGVSLSASTQLIKTNSDGFDPNPAQVVFNAYPTGPAGGVAGVWTTVPAGLALTGSGNTRTLTYEAMQGHESVQVHVSYDDGSVVVSDAITVVRISDGKSALAGFLTNENLSLTVGSAGVVDPAALWAAGGGIFRVFVGQTEITGDMDKISYEVVSATSVQVEIDQAGNFQLTQDMSASMIPRVVIFRATYMGAITIDRQFTLNKVARPAAGQNGARTAEAKVYRLGTSTPQPGAGTATYTWLDGAISAPPQGWFLEPPAPLAGFTLYALTVRLMNHDATPTDSIDWTKGAITPVSVSGSDGRDGTDGDAGPAGLSVRIAYTKLPSGWTLDTGTRDAQGDGSPWTGAWGLGEVWTAQAPLFGVNETVWQVNGIYNPATGRTVWDSPLIATLKVGALSAISANLGSITAGSMDIGGRFIVDSSGYATLRGVRMLDDAGNVIFSLRAGATATLPSGWVTTDQSWLNSNIGINSLGQLVGIGTNNGTIVDNSRVGAVNMLWGAQNGVVTAPPGTVGVMVAWLKMADYNPHGLRPGEAITISAELMRDAAAAADGAVATLRIFSELENGTWAAAGQVNSSSTDVFGGRVKASMTLPVNASDMYRVGVAIYHTNGATNTAGSVMCRYAQVERGPSATLYKPGTEPGATVGAQWNTNVAGQPADAAIMNSQIGINNEGKFYNVSTGQNNVVVSNAQISVSGGAGAGYSINGIGTTGTITLNGMGYYGHPNATQGADWNANVVGRPADTAIMNNQIGINGNGEFYNVATGTSGVKVSNGLIGISNGAIYGIGQGEGTAVANSELVPSINTAATTAQWAGVSGAGRPENNATVGATMGVNVGGTVNSSLAAVMFLDGVFAARHILTPSLSALSANLGAVTAGSITAAYYQSDSWGGRRVTINEDGDFRVYSGRDGTYGVVARIGDVWARASDGFSFGNYTTAEFGSALWRGYGLISRSRDTGLAAESLEGYAIAAITKGANAPTALFASYGDAGQILLAAFNDQEMTRLASPGGVNLGASLAGGGGLKIANSSRVGTILDTNHITITNSPGMPGGGNDGDIVIVV